jgi:hypothetical protein
MGDFGLDRTARTDEISTIAIPVSAQGALHRPVHTVINTNIVKIAYSKRDSLHY